jgi:hypothetical protein
MFRRWWLRLGEYRLMAAGIVLAGVVGAVLRAGLSHRSAAVAAADWSPRLEATPVAEASKAEVERVCAACHVLPPPETFPRDAWKAEVVRGFKFFDRSGNTSAAPDEGRVLRWFQNRAPESLPQPVQMHASRDLPVRFHRTVYPGAATGRASWVANVHFVQLFDEQKRDVLVCDMGLGQVQVLSPYEPAAQLRVLDQTIPHPAHAEVVDLDRDGVKDLIIANLGQPLPTDELVGSVVWLKGAGGRSFTPITLAQGLGRVADVEAADFDGDGDLDLIVAVFGHLAAGEVLYLENRTRETGRVSFAPKTVDERHGAIHVPVADLNGDRRPDFVALISQEHETVVAYLNAGGGRFNPEVIYNAPHPAFGSSGIQVVDLDGDGDLDVLLTNGDVLDTRQLRPYHGVSWLENRGHYPFQHHPITSFYGAHRAVAADVDGDGDMDILATSFLPGRAFNDLRQQLRLDSILLLEQTAPGEFERHALESVAADHLTCDLGDYDGDGMVDLVIGNFSSTFPGETTGDIGGRGAVIIDKNLGPRNRDR